MAIEVVDEHSEKEALETNALGIFRFSSKVLLDVKKIRIERKLKGVPIAVLIVVEQVTVSSFHISLQPWR